jgi:hypothetical protein
VFVYFCFILEIKLLVLIENLLIIRLLSLLLLFFLNSTVDEYQYMYSCCERYQYQVNGNYRFHVSVLLLCQFFAVTISLIFVIKLSFSFQNEFISIPAIPTLIAQFFFFIVQYFFPDNTVE